MSVRMFVSDRMAVDILRNGWLHRILWKRNKPVQFGYGKPR